MSQRDVPVTGLWQELSCRADCNVTGVSGAVQLGMDTELVRVLMTSLVAEPVIGRELELACGTPCDVGGGSGASQVGVDSWLVQVRGMSQRDVSGIGQSRSWLVEVLVMWVVAQELFR